MRRTIKIDSEERSRGGKEFASLQPQLPPCGLLVGLSLQAPYAAAPRRIDRGDSGRVAGVHSDDGRDGGDVLTVAARELFDADLSGVGRAQTENVDAAHHTTAQHITGGISDHWLSSLLCACGVAFTVVPYFP
jgi:hypothetical protein